MTKHLKEEKQMLLVQRMNNIQERTEEIVRITLLQLKLHIVIKEWF